MEPVDTHLCCPGSGTTDRWFDPQGRVAWCAAPAK